ncbi:MAG: SusC/RagA family TonB-linked outer membrane protein [Porphyromonadaceae bacterium]|nr:MAG: SusC/RagA family TonB-linked outer membrane protein [Porphyromonadaceae bacterium]
MKSPTRNEIKLNRKSGSWKIILRFCLIFTVISLVQFTSAKVSAQSSNISLDLKNVSIEEVLNNIESKTVYRFLYNKQLVDVSRKVTVVCKKKKVTQVLSEIFKDSGVDFSINGKQIVLSVVQKANSQPQIKVSGTVKSISGEAIIGATIVVKGTQIGTTSDHVGQFSFEIPEKSTLSISCVGYKKLEYIVGNQRYLDIILEEDFKVLEEVVITAFGIKREEKALGYAVQKVSGTGLQTVKGVDMGTSLTGKIAGLMVKNSTEFAEAPEIQIRGEYPLLVIDGVPYGNMTLRDIPSDDIENLSVLKGATASALYGYRGASGAIIITTKKGNAYKGLSVTVNSGTMYTAGFLAIPEIQSTYGRVVNTATNTYSTGGDGSWGVPMDGREVIQWDPISKSFQAMPYLPRGKDNFKNFLEQGYVLNNNINVVQQGEFGSFRTSATWVNNKGQYPNSMFNKFTYSMGGDMKINKFTLSSNMSFNKQTSPHIGFSGYTSYDPMYTMLVWSAPDYDIKDYKDYWLVPNESQNNSYTDSGNNPYFDRYERTHSLNKDILNGTLALSYDISSWFKLTLRSGFDTYSDRQDIKVSKGSLISAGSATVIPNGSQIWGESANGSFNTGLSRGYSLNNDALLSGNKTLGKFGVDGLLGGTIFYKQDEGVEAWTRDGLSIPGYYSLNASVSPAGVDSRIYRQEVNSLFGRLALSWNRLIYAEGTLRNDWSSTLSLSTRSYLYPSISGSFVASELLPKYDWLSFWKIRSSWTSSKTPAGIYEINSVYSITNNAWGSLSSASYPNTIRGTDVHPESSSTFETGTAINLFKNRASADISYYSKRMYDALKSTGISSASGYSYNYINIDEEVTRKGMEISANVSPVKTKDWQCDISVNWSKYARYYTKLDSVYSEDKPWVKLGERADSYILYDYQKDPDGNIIHSNGLPLYSAYESNFGYYDPDWIWGVNTKLRFKDFEFNISFDGRVGGLASTTTEMYMWRAGSHPSSLVPERYLDATVPGSKNYIGQGVKVVSGSATYDTYGNITSDTRVYAPNDEAVTYETYTNTLHKGTAWGGASSPLDVYTTSFFKIREMSLTYNLPKEFCTRFYSKGVSVSVVGQNVFLWAKQFKYSDPDGGYENFSDPSLRYLGFNLKVTF